MDAKIGRSPLHTDSCNLVRIISFRHLRPETLAATYGGKRLSAEGVGFEPTWGESPPSDFESAPLGLSGIPPGKDYMFAISRGAC